LLVIGLIAVLLLTKIILNTMSLQPWEMTDYPEMSDPSSNIRVLHIKKGSGKQRIDCTLESVPLARNPVYDALSYNWGNMKKPKMIKVNGKKMLITNNLYEALRDIRLPGETRTVWVDQICINQNNVEEKEGQIPLMNTIYSRAQNVLVWLSNHKAPRWVENSREIDWAGGWAVAHATLYPRAAIYWLYRLSEEEYWKRCWIIQEITVASNIVVHSGSVPIPWKEFIKLGKWYESNYAKANVKNILKLEALRHSYHSDREKFTLAHTLINFRDAFCSSTHDKIFAFLGMADECLDGNCVAVDYSSSPHSLYHDILRFPNHLLKDPLDWQIGLPYLSGVIRHVLTKKYKYVPKVLEYFGTAADPNSNLYAACGDEREIDCLKDPTGNISRDAREADSQAAFFQWILSFFKSSPPKLQTVWLPSTAEDPTNWLPESGPKAIPRELLVRGVITGEINQIGPLYSEVSKDENLGSRWLIDNSVRYGQSRPRSRAIISRFMSLIRMSDFVRHVAPFGDTDTGLHRGIRLFLGSDVMVGMVPANSRPGDLICQFWGSHVVTILRPTDHDDYEIVGKAVVMRQLNSFAWDVLVNKTTFRSPSSRMTDLMMSVNTLAWLTLDSIHFDIL
jgi:hypothetical protein